MAGVAPSSRGGSNATTIGMVIAIVVAVSLLGVLIWLFTLQEELRNRADLAERSRAKLVRGSDETTARKQFPNATGNKTLIGEMNNGIQMIQRRLTGNPNDTVSVAIAGLDRALSDIRADETLPEDAADRLSPEFGAVKIIEELHQLYQQTHDALVKAEGQRDKTDASLEKARAAERELKGNFDQQVARLQAKVDELQRNKQALEDDKNTENSALKQEIEAKRVELDQMRRQQAKLKLAFRKRLVQQRQFLDEQRLALKQLRGSAPLDAQPLATARKPVGRVLRALPGDSLVHIDLGREDNVVLGMTFSVYSADERVPSNGRGKASIEVVSVSHGTSECRVVSPPSPDDPILEGDFVGNIVLNRKRNKKPRFSVVGRFDVDFDGAVDIRGRDKIIAVIERWGGVVVDHVDALTDYVVVGLEPPGGEIALPSDFENGSEKLELLASDDEDSGATATTTEENTEDDESGLEDDSDESEDDEASPDDEEDSGDEDEADDADDSEDDGEDEDDDADEDDADEDGLGFNGDQDVEPRIIRRPEVDPTLVPQRRRYRNERQQYEDALRRANMFSIPVLTQEQFFNFIGIEGSVSDVRRLQG